MEEKKEKTDSVTGYSLPPLQTDESRLITVSQLDRERAKWAKNPTLSFVMDAVLGLERYQRLRTAGILFYISLYAILIFIEQLLVVMNYVKQSQVVPLIAYEVVVSLASYIIVRTSFNLRFRNPRLTFAHIIAGMIALLWLYGISGPVRGAIMCLIIQTLIFAIFSVTRTQSRWISIYSFMALGAVMLYQSQFSPEIYPPAVEFIHFLVTAIVFISISILSERMSKLRGALKKKKRELEQALSKIKLLATLDELTGLLNRRAMLELMSAEKVKQKRDSYTVALVLIDIDYFKKINDTYGHFVGDEVLCLFSKLTKKTLREGDAFSRWGGEEFLLMLPNKSVEEAEACVVRIRSSLASIAISPTEPDLSITFSAGISILHKHISIEKAIEKADQAMYQAKNDGRNCTRVSYPKERIV